jgi:hypothetical protein
MMGPSYIVSSLKWLAVVILAAVLPGFLAQRIETKGSFGGMPPLTTGTASMRAAMWCGLRIKAAEAAALKGGRQEEAGLFKR